MALLAPDLVDLAFERIAPQGLLRRWRWNDAGASEPSALELAWARCSEASRRDSQSRRRRMGALVWRAAAAARVAGSGALRAFAWRCDKLLCSLAALVALAASLARLAPSVRCRLGRCAVSAVISASAGRRFTFLALSWHHASPSLERVTLGVNNHAWRACSSRGRR